MAVPIAKSATTSGRVNGLASNIRTATGTTSGSPVSAYSTSTGDTSGTLGWYTPYVNPYAQAQYSYQTPYAQSEPGNKNYLDYLGMTPEQQTAYLDYQSGMGLPSWELESNALQQAQAQAQQNAQFLANFQQGQYTDEAAIALAQQQQQWSEYWDPLQQQNELTANASLQNQMVDWYGREQQADITNQQGLQNQMVGWYTTEQQNQLAANRETQAAQIKADAENAALSAWGRRSRPNSRYL
jgi:hypothetical protein